MLRWKAMFAQNVDENADNTSDSSNVIFELATRSVFNLITRWNPEIGSFQLFRSLRVISLNEKAVVDRKDCVFWGTCSFAITRGEILFRAVERRVSLRPWDPWLNARRRRRCRPYPEPRWRSGRTGRPASSSAQCVRAPRSGRSRIAARAFARRCASRCDAPYRQCALADVRSARRICRERGKPVENYNVN